MAKLLRHGTIWDFFGQLACNSLSFKERWGILSPEVKIPRHQVSVPRADKGRLVGDPAGIKSALLQPWQGTQAFQEDTSKSQDPE